MAPIYSDRADDSQPGYPYLMVVPDGERVIDLRRARDWSQARLAAETDLSARTIWNIEQGTPVRRDTMEAVAETLNVGVYELILPRFDPKTGQGCSADNLTLSVRQGTPPSLPTYAGPHTPLPPTRAVRASANPLAPPAESPALRKCSLLVVDDEPSLRALLHRALSPTFEVLIASNVAEAVAILAQRPVDILLTDQEMPGGKGGELLEWARQAYPRTLRLLMTGYPDFETAVSAINEGRIFHYIKKPYDLNALHLVLCNAAVQVEFERDRDEILAELDRRNRQLEEKNRELLEANQQLELRMRERELEAQYDPMTGVLNRRTIEELGRTEIRRTNRYPRPLSIGLIQVDPFKSSKRDPLSPGSDEVLGELAHILSTSLRREVDSVGRLHGELFLVLARETGHDGATRLAERIRARIAATGFVAGDQTFTLTVSIGFAASENGGNATLAEMVGAANAALAEAQAAGGNCSVVRHQTGGLPEAG